jgi:hypothetical protein
MLLAKRARALAEQGLSLRQVAARLQQLRDQTGIVFSVNDMRAPAQRTAGCGAAVGGYYAGIFAPYSCA